MATFDSFPLTDAPINLISRWNLTRGQSYSIQHIGPGPASAILHEGNSVPDAGTVAITTLSPKQAVLYTVHATENLYAWLRSSRAVAFLGCVEGE